jgi:hypothetical protein
MRNSVYRSIIQATRVISSHSAGEYSEIVAQSLHSQCLVSLSRSAQYDLIWMQLSYSDSYATDLKLNRQPVSNNMHREVSQLKSEYNNGWYLKGYIWDSKFWSRSCTDLGTNRCFRSALDCWYFFSNLTDTQDTGLLLHCWWKLEKLVLCVRWIVENEN